MKNINMKLLGQIYEDKITKPKLWGQNYSYKNMKVQNYYDINKKKWHLFIINKIKKNQ